MTRRLATPDEAVALLAAGGVLLLPTDTLPGLHARVDRPAAVRRVAAIKGRPGDKPLVVLAGSLAAVQTILGPLSARQLDYAQRCWPGPFSLVLPAATGLDPAITAGGVTVAVRVPDHPQLGALLRALPGPLVSTSANRSGEPAALTLEEAEARLGAEVDGVFALDEASDGTARASCVIDLTVWPPRVLRPGPRPAPGPVLDPEDGES